MTVVKEAVDNALEFTCEANILPEIKILVKEIEENRFKVVVEDNGPGVVPEKVPNAFGKILYGSAFHKLKQSRSLFGIGIKGACLYAQLTTGKPIKVRTAIGKNEVHEFEIMIDVTKNQPIVVSHDVDKIEKKQSGLRVELEVIGRYIEGSQSIPEYIKATAMSNPYATIIFEGPKGKMSFKRITNTLPKIAKEIKPHPYGVDLGILRRMLSSTKAKSTLKFLTTEFCRVGEASAKKICKEARIPFSKKPQELDLKESERLKNAMQKIKLISPPTDCLSPLGEKLIEEGLKSHTEAEYVVAATRSPSVYSGMPFMIEVGLAYGGKLPQDQQTQIYRFANKVPLIYHQGDCVITKCIKEIDWRRYGLSQSEGQVPFGPLAILVHIASVWIPFTSEGKQSIANYPEIAKEIKLALQEIGRKLGSYMRGKRKSEERSLRIGLFERYIPELAENISELTDENKNRIIELLKKIMKGEVIEGSETENEGGRES